MPLNPNPQGKAALPLLQELQTALSSPVPDRTPLDLARDYLASLLVLSAEFRFRPVPGKTYYLYFRQQRWQLSLVSPEEWSPPRQEDFVARCTLRHDASWDVAPSDAIAANPHLQNALLRFQDQFTQRVADAGNLRDGLPHYERALPYYRRVLASALSKSLDVSLHRLGLESSDGQQLLSTVTAAGSALPLLTLAGDEAAPA
jgi:hypothetical protein